MPLFPENLDPLRNAAPDLQPTSIQMINRLDGTKELIFPDGSTGIWNPAETKADHWHVIASKQSCIASG